MFSVIPYIYKRLFNAISRMLVKLLTSLSEAFGVQDEHPQVKPLKLSFDLA